MSFHRFHRRSVLHSTWIAAVLGGLAGAQGGERQAGALPNMQDVKTPAPAAEVVEPAEVRSEQASTPANVPFKSIAREVRERFVPAVEVDTVLFDSEADGTLWALGAQYKASFGVNGTQYVPNLGSNAPRNFPFNMTLASVAVGGEAIAFDASILATRDGNTVSYSRGSITEIYELSPQSIEQKFTFTSLPQAGELAVRIAIESEMTPELSAQGMRFSNQHGAVLYGKATVLDAAGRSLALHSQLTDGAIEITVPEAFLGEATFPVTIDPVISTFAVDSSSETDFAPDVAYDALNNQYLVCFQRFYSSGDYDVFSQRHTSSGALVAGSGVYIDFTTTSWGAPRVAYQAASDKFLVAAVAGASPERTIRGRIRNAGSNTMGSQFTISGSESGDKLNVDVGGDPYPSGTAYFLVAWERVYSTTDRDVHARLVTPSGTNSGSVIMIDNSGSTVDTMPAVSKSNNESTWGVVWQRRQTSTNYDIRGARINWDGAITNASFGISTSSSNDQRPEVSPMLDGSSRYLVVFERRFSTDADIKCYLMSGTTLIDSITLNGVGGDGSDLFQDQLRAAVDTDGNHFAVAYSEQYSTSTSDYDVYVSDVYVSGTQLGVAEGHRNLAFSTTFEFDVKMAAVHSGGDTSRRCMLVWDDANANIEGGIYESVLGGPVTTVCPGDGTSGNCPCFNNGASGHGCANSANAAGALLGRTGGASTTNDTMRLQATGLPTNVPVFFLQSTGLSAPVFSHDGLRCVTGTIIRLGDTASGTSGTTSFPSGSTDLSDVGLVPAGGATRYYQCWYRNGAAGFCPPGVINWTNGLRVVWTN